MKFFIPILFLLFTGSAQAFESQVLKYAADQTGTQPSEISQYVKFGLVSSIKYSDEVNLSDMSAAATAAGMDLSAFKRVDIAEWNLEIPRPTPEQLEAVVDIDLVNRPASHAVYTNGIWVAIPWETIRAEEEAQRQAAKPLERKVYENQFFDLIEQLYNATGVTNEVTPKLGFPEIQSLIETVQATDPMAAVNYSLKLLSIDAALKRYDVLWWDDAIQHVIPEE